jgi:hypothetical protein
MPDRTVREFSFSGDLWSVVDGWCKENGFTVQTSTSTRREYQKGRDGFDFPLMLLIEQQTTYVRLETWIKGSSLRTLFLTPREIGLESGGMALVVARNKSRATVNELLQRLDQPPIK